MSRGKRKAAEHNARTRLDIIRFALLLTLAGPVASGLIEGNLNHDSLTGKACSVVWIPTSHLPQSFDVFDVRKHKRYGLPFGNFGSCLDFTVSP